MIYSVWKSRRDGRQWEVTALLPSGDWLIEVVPGYTCPKRDQQGRCVSATTLKRFYEEVKE
jgi:hypothetical protein